jgi:hypothetical protein
MVKKYSDNNIELLRYPRVPCRGPLPECNKLLIQYQDCKDKGDIKPNIYSDMIVSCALEQNLTKDEYDEAKKYFKDNFNITLQEELPDFSCKNISIEQRCKDPYGVFKLCAAHKSVAPYSPEIEESVVKGCAPNVPQDKWNKYRAYFKEKTDKDIGEQPDILCKRSPTKDDICPKPTSYFKFCKEDVPTQQDVNTIVDCAKFKRVPIDEYNKVKNYLSTKNFTIPDNDIVRADCANVDICNDPLPKLKYCKPTYRTTTDNEDLQQISYCIRNNKLTDNQYSEVKTYFEQKGLTVPEKASIDCIRDCNTINDICSHVSECYKCDRLINSTRSPRETELKFWSEDCVNNNFEQVSKEWGYLKEKEPLYFTEAKYRAAYDKAISEGKSPLHPTIYYMPPPPPSMGPPLEMGSRLRYRKNIPIVSNRLRKFMNYT